MNDRFINNFISKVKDKFTKQKTTYSSNYEYAFSTEEIESISEQNKQKIIELKQDIFDKKKEVKEKIDTDEVLSKIETNIKDDDEITKPIPIIHEKEAKQKEEVKEEKKKEEKGETQPSFINLSEEHQKLVMDKWNEINNSKIDRDIINGKDLLNHNYTITYADEAAKYIHYIRREYEVVICYLIGFNNEKQGIINKTIFSDKIDNEWKYLNNYIKLLEKIRNFKK